MNKLETQLSRKWIGNLCRQVTERGERIRFVKIHGETMQETSIADYLLCYHGKFFALEFKVFPNTLEPKQRDFLIDVFECGGIAMVIEIHSTKERYSKGMIVEDLTENADGYYKEGQELMTLKMGEIQRKDLIYPFIYT